MNAVAEARFVRPNLLAGLNVVRQPAVWLPLLAFLLYLPPALAVLQLGPDNVSYIDIARRLSAGDGYLLGVKSFHFGDMRALHDGLDERPPLYPLLAAGLLRVGFNPYGLQLVNAVLAAVCAALVYAIGTALFDKRTGLLAGGLAAISPTVLIHMVPPLADALAISLLLLATWLLVRNLDSPSVGSFAAAGSALGLVYLARPTTAAPMAALMLGVVLASRNKRTLIRPLAALVLAAAVFITPITLHSLATRGSPFYLVQGQLYAVWRDSEIAAEATLQPLPRPADFIMANPERLARAVGSNIRAYANSLFLDSKSLLPLLLAWPVVLVSLLLGRYPRAVLPILLLASANFLFCALTWSTFQRRYLLPTMLLLLPLAVDGLVRLGLPRLKLAAIPGITGLHLAVLVSALVWSPVFVQHYSGKFFEGGGNELAGTRSYHGVRWTGPLPWVEDRDLSSALDWVNANAERDDVLAHFHPAIFTFFTERPSIRLPRKLAPDTLKSLLVQYRVAYVLLNSRDASWRAYGDDLMALDSEGVRATTVASYRVFDTRSLWR